MNELEVIPAFSVPVYNWETGNLMYPTREEKLICDVLADVMDYKACSESLKANHKKDISVRTIINVLSKANCKEYMTQLLKDRGYFNGFTKEHCVAMLTEHLTGKHPLDKLKLYAIKIGAEIMGFESAKTQVQNNLQINFTQANGKE